jgi:chromate transporter
LGGALATWVTFAPSFLWIFVGAPYAERIQSVKALRAALQGVTAAVLGVILNLAIWFGSHVLLTDVQRITTGPMQLWTPNLGSIDIAALALSALAALMLICFKWGVIPVLLVCASAGLALQLTKI